MSELKHYGVKGMRWRHHKVRKVNPNIKVTKNGFDNVAILPTSPNDPTISLRDARENPRLSQRQIAAIENLSGNKEEDFNSGHFFQSISHFSHLGREVVGNVRNKRI